MKKRLLALCLAAALLLGMMPALTLSTNAADAVPDVKTLDFASGTRTGLGYVNDTNMFRAGYLQFKTSFSWQGSATDIPDLSFDHTKVVLFEQTYNPAGIDQATVGGITVASGSLAILANTMAFTLMDADNGGSFLYYGITGSGTAGGGYKVRFLKADDTMEDIPLTGAETAAEFKLGIRWNINGTVTVFVNGTEIATTASNVTWSVVSTENAGTKNNPQTTLMNGGKTTACDFLNVVTNISSSYAYILDQAGKQTTITTTEDLPEEPDVPAPLLNGAIDHAALVNKGGAPEWSKYNAWLMKTTSVLSHTLTTPDKAFALDHSMDITLDVAMTFYTDNTKLNDTAGLITDQGLCVTIVDGDTGKYVAANLYSSADGNYKIAVEGSSTAIVIGPNNANIAGVTYKWNADDSLTVLVGGDEKGTIANATKTNAEFTQDKIQFDYRYAAAGTGNCMMYLGVMSGAHTEPEAPVSLLNGAIDHAALVNKGGAPEWSKYNAWLMKTTSVLSHTLTTPNKAFALDHSKDITLDVAMTFYTDNTKLNDTAGLITDQGLCVTIVDGDTGKYVAANLYSSADGNYKIAVEGSSTAIVIGPNNANIAGVTYKWNADDSLTVLVGGDEKGTIANATKTNAEFTQDKIQFDYRYAAAGTGNCMMYLGVMSGAHTEPVLPATDADAIFTVEPMAADNMLVEASWSKAAFVKMSGIDTAVLVNKGVAYVALKSKTAQTASVKLGDTTKDVTFVNGVAEVAFDDLDLTAYGETRSLTVTANGVEATVTLTFAAKQIKITPTDTNILENLPDGYPAYDMYHNGTDNYLRIKATQTTTAYGIWGKSGEYGDVVINRDYAVRINWNMSFQAGFFIDEKVSWTLASNMLTPSASNVVQITFKDYETNTFVNAFLTAGDGNKVYLGIIDKDVKNEYVDLGLDATEAVDLSNLYLIWNTDGSVTVQLGDEVKGTVQNATWTPSGNVGRSTNPSVNGGTTATTYDFARMYTNTSGGNNQGYFAGLSFTDPNSVEVVDIDTELNKKIGYSVDLGADIGLNFIVTEDAGATITVNAAGKETVHNADKLPVEDGKYLVEANVAAAQMTEAITVTIVDAHGFTRFDSTTTVKDYLNELKSKPADYNMTEAMLTLVDEMLDYGAAAQKYFGYNTEYPAVEEIVISGDLAGLDANLYNPTTEGTLPGIEPLSAALVLDEKVIIRYYFKADSVEDFTFVYDDDKALTAELSLPKTEKYGFNVWYVDVEVNPQDMGTEYVVSVNDTLNFGYSCMTYMTKYDDVPELNELLNTMYDYYIAAAAVKPAN